VAAADISASESLGWVEGEAMRSPRVIVQGKSVFTGFHHRSSAGV